MKTFNDYLEMAHPRQEDINKKYYHGTNKISDANDILKNGIQPPDLTMRPKHKLTPREGKVYITPDIKYAQIYAIGGDMAGHDWVDQDALTAGRKYGYLFVIDGKDLKDIEPDEDSVGEFIYNLYKKEITNKELTTQEKYFMHNNVKFNLTIKQKEKIQDGEYAEFAHVGKKLIPKMNILDKFLVIDQPGSHIAHTGPLIPSEAWQIELTKIKDLKRDGSNFFKLAKRIK